MKPIVVTGLTAFLMSPVYALGSTDPATLEWHDATPDRAAAKPKVPEPAASSPDQGVVLTNKSPGHQAPSSVQELLDPSTGIMLLTNRPQGPREAAVRSQTPRIATPPRREPTNGQWVYTAQYGWLFMPYGSRYTSEGSTGDECPREYVYEPSHGWTWLPAPWVWGWGAYPYFGATGPWKFGWYRGLYRAGYVWGTYRGGGPGHRQPPTAG